jgi:hypothetical protein
VQQHPPAGDIVVSAAPGAGGDRPRGGRGDVAGRTPLRVRGSDGRPGRRVNAYLDRGHADPTADSVGYRQIPLWLNQDELAELISELRTIIVSKMDNEPAADRRLHRLSPIVFPIEEPPQHRTAKRTDRPS